MSGSAASSAHTQKATIAPRETLNNAPIATLPKNQATP